MNPTSEQLAAIQTIDRALLVEAGAGTGKTWVLVQRFLYLLEQHPDWPVNGIVAITYTEKAAREMRTRVRQALERRAAERPSDSAWQTRRRDLDQLQVSTIHGLCARILRENAIAAGLDPRFAVLDENQANLLKEEAVEIALANLTQLDRANPENTGQRQALELLSSLQVVDLRDQLVDLLRKRGTVARLFDELPGSDQLLERWQAETTSMRAGLIQDQLQRDAAFREAMQELPQLQVTDSGDKLTPAVLHGKTGCLLASQGDLAGACQEWLQIDLRGGKASSWGGADELKDIRSALKAVREPAKNWADSGYLQEVGEADQKAAQSLQQWKALWDAVSDTYRRMKAEQFSLDFDDLELLTGQLSAQRPRPDRLQAYLDGICHLMVDEFQDTNQAQQGIVYALANPQDGGRLFVVGDAKQSIYRFRQAQVAVFNRTARDIHLATGCPPVPLSCSFRTHEQLVSALNSLFAVALQPLGERHSDYEAHPGPLQHQRPSLGEHAPVELILLPQKDAQDESIHAEEARIFEARLLAGRLLQLQAEGYQVWDKEKQVHRPFRFDDAAILFRSTTNMPLYEEQFKAAGLPYLTVSGRGYFDRPEVRDLIALLGCLHNPADDLNLAAALRSPLFNLSDETLYALRWHEPGSEGQAYVKSQAPIPYLKALHNPPPTDQAKALAFAAGVIDELLGMTGRAQVWRLLRIALDRTGFETVLTLSDQEQRSGGRQRSNITKFMNLARQDGGASLSGFLRSIADLRASEAREGEGLADAPESGAVQLMSIHASKGLEFPVVAVADLGRDQGRARGTQRLMHDPAFGLVCMIRDENGDWVQPASCVWASWLDSRMETAENKRLLYVACTRAADLLILSGQTGKDTSWLGTIQTAWEIDDDGPEEQLLARAGFALRVQRPAYQDDEPRRQLTARPAAAPVSITKMSAFALPLPALNQALPLPVTQLERLLRIPAAGEEDREQADEEEAAPVRPALRPKGPQSGHVPAFLIGRVVHRALADWDCLEQNAVEQARRIEIYARREGIHTAEMLGFTLGRCGRIIANLRAAPLYREICAAQRRYSEIPFTLTASAGILHGVIDLLYEDAQGRWHLVDWKSEHVNRDQLQTHAEQHTLQVAIYAEAARATLGQMPQVSVCFLTAGSRVWTYTQASLEDALRTVR